MSYGLNFCEHYGRATYYVDGGFGTHPSDLPIEVPKTFEFIIDLTTASRSASPFPQTLLARRRAGQEITRSRHQGSASETEHR